MSTPQEGESSRPENSETGESVSAKFDRVFKLYMDTVKSRMIAELGEDEYALQREFEVTTHRALEDSEIQEVERYYARKEELRLINPDFNGYDETLERIEQQIIDEFGEFDGFWFDYCKDDPNEIVLAKKLSDKEKEQLQLVTGDKKWIITRTNKGVVLTEAKIGFDKEGGIAHGKLLQTEVIGDDSDEIVATLIASILDQLETALKKD